MELIPVLVNGSLVVFHTREEYEALWAGVDREACEVMAEED